MNIDLLRLKNNVDKIVEIDENVSFKDYDFLGTDLIDLSSGFFGRGRDMAPLCKGSCQRS